MVSALLAPSSFSPVAFGDRWLRLLAAVREAEGVRVAEAGRFESDGRSYEIPRIEFRGPQAAHDPIRLGVFAGVHGDEPAGGHAVIEWILSLLERPDRLRGYELCLYPLCNPTGIEDGTRHCRAGADLNRQFWCDSPLPEVAILERELARGRFQGLITLHADDTSDGLYGYAHGHVLNEALLKPALAAASAHLPVNRAAAIDGWKAEHGIIHECFCGVLSAPKDQRPQPFDLIFETPARAPLDLQIQAAVVALDVILDEYRGFIAHAQDL